MTKIWSQSQLDDAKNVIWIHTVNVDAAGNPLAPVRFIAIESIAAECGISFREACECARHESRTDPQHNTLWTIRGNAVVIAFAAKDSKPRVVSELARRGSPLAVVPDAGESKRHSVPADLAMSRAGTTQIGFIACPSENFETSNERLSDQGSA